MLKILDRYLVREIVLPLLPGAGRCSRSSSMMPPILQQGGAAHRQGRASGRSSCASWCTLLPQALVHHDSDGAAARHPHRLRPPVGRPRVRRACRRAASASSGCCGRSRCSPALGTAATAYEMIVALPDANQTFREITFGVVASRRGKRRQAARVLPGLPQPRDLRPRHCRPTAAGATCSSPTRRAPTRRRCISRARGGIVLDRDEEARAARARSTARSTRRHIDKPDEYEGSDFERLDHHARPETGLPARRRRKGDHEMTIAELQATRSPRRQAHSDPALRASSS